MRSKGQASHVRTQRRQRRSDLPRRRTTLANASSFQSRTPSPTASRMPASSNSTIKDKLRSTRPTLPTAAGRFVPNCSKPRTFQSFRMAPLAGSAARNKGMALFPRKIDGRYAMIARQDNENLYLIYSDDLYTWEGGTPDPPTRTSLGIRADRQLWIADRA